MEHHTASTSPVPYSGEDWFDALEEAVRFQVRAFIEAMVEEEAQAALGCRKRYQRDGKPRGHRNGNRDRQLVGTFGAVTVSLPRARLFDGDGREREWNSQVVQAYKRLTKRAEVVIASAYLGGTNTRRVHVSTSLRRRRTTCGNNFRRSGRAPCACGASNCGSRRPRSDRKLSSMPL